MIEKIFMIRFAYGAKSIVNAFLTLYKENGVMSSADHTKIVDN